MEVAALDTPSLVVDLDVMEANISRMAAYASSHGLKLRPHVKTHKVPYIAHRQLQAGAVGITVAKVGEAEVMRAAGITDILVGYPVVGQAKLERLMRLAVDAQITVAADTLATAQGLSAAAAAAGTRLRVYLEYDTGFHRCGVATPAELVSLAERVQDLPGLDLRGVMVFPGHLSRPAEEDRTAMLAAESERLQAALGALRAAGVEVRELSGGSTPTAMHTHRLPGVTEIRPGTYVFNDMNEVAMGVATEADCAARFHVTVVSVQKEHMIIDAGSKTLASDQPRRQGAGFGRIVGHPEALIARLTEEHGIVDTTRCSHRFQVGERLEVIPNHVCVTVNLHDEMVLTRRGQVQAMLPIMARGKVK